MWKRATQRMRRGLRWELGRWVGVLSGHLSCEITGSLESLEFSDTQFLV